MDSSLSFIEHVRSAGMKVTRTVNALARILPNIGGPTPARRKLLAGVVSSELLYAAPTWASAIVKREHCVKHLRVAFRKAALRVITAYRTTSYETVTLPSSITTIELSASKREKIQSCTNAEKATDVRRLTTRQWQTMWDSASNGRWTQRLLPDVICWTQKQTRIQN